MIEGQKILLRAPEPDDVGLLYDWENDTSIWATGDSYSPISINDLKALIEHSDLDIYQTRQMRLMIVDKATHITVGCIDMFEFDPFNMHAAIGILIDKNYRRQHFAKNAISVFCDYLFNTLHIKAILATITCNNCSSRALFESCNFEHIGTYKQWKRQNNSYLDVEIFEKIAK